MATTDPSPPEPSDLQDLIRPIWRRKWLLLAIVVLSTAATYVVSSQRPVRYRSSTQVFVAGSQIASIMTPGQTPSSDRTTLDQAKLVLSAPVTRAVIALLRLRDTPQALVRTVSATPDLGSNFVTVTAERRSGLEAAAVANAYVQQYLRYRTSQVTTEAAAATNQLRAQLAQVPIRNAAQRQILGDAIRQVQAAAAAAAGGPSQPGPAIVPRWPFAPQPERDAAFALAIALGLALGLAFSLERFDRRIKTVDEAARVYAMPLLSVIPHTSTAVALHDGKAAVPPRLREPFRSLRTNVQLASLDKPVKRLVVASAISGEGKSTLIINLALTYREWGLSVAILEADLRRPSLGGYLGVESGLGLASVLTGSCALEDALIDVGVDVEVGSLEYLDKLRLEATDAQYRTATAPSAKRLALLPSGPTPPNPQAVLESEKMRRLVDSLSETFDMVLIDTPPLLAVGDAIPLLSQCDGVILVTRVGLTERQSAQRAAAAAQVTPDVRVLGVVANDVAYEPGAGYGYGYGYGAGYG